MWIHRTRIPRPLCTSRITGNILFVLNEIEEYFSRDCLFFWFFSHFSTTFFFVFSHFQHLFFSHFQPPFFFFLKKKQSSNGTFLNNEVIGKGNKVHLNDQDHITFLKSPQTSFLFKRIERKPNESGIFDKYTIGDVLGQ